MMVCTSLRLCIYACGDITLLFADAMFHFTCFNVDDPQDPSVGLIDGQLAIPGILLRREVFDPVVGEVCLSYRAVLHGYLIIMHNFQVLPIDRRANTTSRSANPCASPCRWFRGQRVSEALRAGRLHFHRGSETASAHPDFFRDRSDSGTESESLRARRTLTRQRSGAPPHTAWHAGPLSLASSHPARTSCASSSLRNKTIT